MIASPHRASLALAGLFGSTAIAGSPVNLVLNGDGEVDGADLGVLLSMWGPFSGCMADLNGSGVVDGADLGPLLARWAP